MNEPKKRPDLYRVAPDALAWRVTEKAAWAGADHPAPQAVMLPAFTWDRCVAITAGGRGHHESARVCLKPAATFAPQSTGATPLGPGPSAPFCAAHGPTVLTAPVPRLTHEEKDALAPAMLQGLLEHANTAYEHANTTYAADVARVSELLFGTRRTTDGAP